MPPARSSRNFAGRMTRPLSSSFGVCVPSSIGHHPHSFRPTRGAPHFTPLPSTFLRSLWGESRVGRRRNEETPVITRNHGGGAEWRKSGGPVEDRGGREHEKSPDAVHPGFFSGATAGSALVLASVPSVVHAVHEGGVAGARVARRGIRGRQGAGASNRGEGEDRAAEHGEEGDDAEDDAADGSELPARGHGGDEPTDSGEQQQGA